MRTKKMSGWRITAVLYNKMISYASKEIIFRDIIYNLFTLSTENSKILYWDKNQHQIKNGWKN